MPHNGGDLVACLPALERCHERVDRARLAAVAPLGSHLFAVFAVVSAVAAGEGGPQTSPWDVMLAIAAATEGFSATMSTVGSAIACFCRACRLRLLARVTFRQFLHD